MHSPPRLISVLLGIALSFVACATPDGLTPGNRASVEALLSNQNTRPQISQYVGKAHFRCLVSSPTTELCEWQLGDRNPGWSPLANAIGTGARVALLCEFQTNGGPRAVHACSAHPMRSNRREFPVRTHRSSKGRQPTASDIAEMRDEYQAIARAGFAESLTLTEVSRLMGATPDSCVDESQGWRRCLWRASSRTYGHGTVVSWIRGDPRKKARLTCVFPKSGGPRIEECVGEEGA